MKFRDLLASVVLVLGLGVGGFTAWGQENAQGGEKTDNPPQSSTESIETDQASPIESEGAVDVVNNAVLSPESSTQDGDSEDSSNDPTLEDINDDVSSGSPASNPLMALDAPTEPEKPQLTEEEMRAIESAALDKHLREVSNQVDSLKEDTFSTKSRLLLLREEVLRRSVSGARLILVHNNDMGHAFELVRVLYAVDRESKYMRVDSENGLNDLDQEVVFDGIMTPGDHFLTVQYIFKGKKWGVFKYMSDFTFKVESGYAFELEEGSALEISITAMEQGGAFTAYEDRPSMSFTTRSFDLAASQDENSKTETVAKTEQNAKK